MQRTLIWIAGLLFAGSVLAVPDELEDSYAKLQTAVTNKDAAQVKELAPKVCELARQSAAKPAPQDADEKARWEKSVKYAKELEVYSEYALYSIAVQSPPATQVEFFEMLVKQSPKSKYLGMGYGQYLVALSQAGQAARIREVAQRGIVNFPNDLDLLLVMADWDMNHNQTASAGVHAERLLAAASRSAAPEHLSAADWERKKAQAMGRAYWIAGMAHSAKAEYSMANQDLRNALPRIAGNDAMLAAAYFHLGVANYHLGRQGLNFRQVQEAAAFSEKAAAIKGPYQQQAWTNAHLMKQEAEKMRGAR